MVSYLPDPLAGFLNRLRAEFSGHPHARAHVTVLPPRPLVCGSEQAWSVLQQGLQDFQPFRVELGQIEIFPVTQVIYLSVSMGEAELKRLHEKLNHGCVAFEEPFVYHPHVTLAQDLEAAEVQAVFDRAAAQWREFSHARSFVVDRLTFVQNTLENRWTDLHACGAASNVTT